MDNKHPLLKLLLGAIRRRAISNGEPDHVIWVKYVYVQRSNLKRQQNIAVASTPLDSAFFETPNIPVTFTGVVRLKRRDSHTGDGDDENDTSRNFIANKQLFCNHYYIK
jgi:hypothetical protein